MEFEFQAQFSLPVNSDGDKHQGHPEQQVEDLLVQGNCPAQVGHRHGAQQKHTDQFHSQMPLLPVVDTADQSHRNIEHQCRTGDPLIIHSGQGKQRNIRGCSAKPDRGIEQGDDKKYRRQPK